MTLYWNSSAGTMNRAADIDDSLSSRCTQLAQTCGTQKEPAHVDDGSVMDLPPDVELFLSTARTRVDSYTATRIRATALQGIDWPHLTAAAHSHGTTPLLYSCLNATCPEAVPPAVLDELRRDYDANARHSRLLTEELILLAKLFESHGIRAIPFKGPVLAASVYGDCALRQFVDLDILVSKRDVPRARDLLIANGYRPRKQRNDLQEAAFLRLAREYPFLRFAHEYPFVREDGQVGVDLHWGITPRWHFFHVNFESMWRRAGQVSLAATSVPTLAPEDLIMVLCVHGAKHRWQRLQWICDVAEVVRAHPEMDWEYTAKQARRRGCERMLFLGLSLASGLLGTALPAGIAHRLHDTPTVEVLAAQICKQLFNQTGAPPGRLEKSLFHLRVRERLRDRVRCVMFFLIHTVITPTTGDLEFLRLPPGLFHIYYVVRPFRVLGKYGRQGLKKILNYHSRPRVAETTT